MKSHFITSLKAEHLGGRWWKLLAPLIYYSEELKTEVIAPKNFVTDFASVPRFPVLYWLFGSKADGPAAIHDVLYRWAEYPRLTSDKVFLEAMKIDGYWFFTRYPMYTGVVLGGHWSYKTLPGCLDHRNCNKNIKLVGCKYCAHFIDYWQDKQRLINESMDRSIPKGKVHFIDYPNNKPLIEIVN